MKAKSPFVFASGLAGILALAISLCGARADSDPIDFENISNELPGWSATAQTETKENEYRTAAKWDTPFAFSLDSDKPHGGATSLKWEFTADNPGTASFGPPIIPVPGTDITIRFFVRSEGMSSEGMFVFDESQTDGKRLKSHWAAAKIPESSDWAEVTWTGKIDPGAAGLRVRFVYKAIPAGAKLWLDDLTVTANSE